jgi:hypothetical protein
MVAQIGGNPANTAQIGVVTSGELKKMASEQAGEKGAQPIDTVQISQGRTDELALTEREMKLLGKIKRHEFLHAFTSADGIGAGEKLTIVGGGGGMASMFSAMAASSLGASLPMIGAAIVAAPVALYIATSVIQGVSNARDAEREWSKTFIDSSEKDSMKKVLDEYPMLGYRYQI